MGIRNIHYLLPVLYTKLLINISHDADIAAAAITATATDILLKYAISASLDAFYGDMVSNYCSLKSL